MVHQDIEKKEILYSKGLIEVQPWGDNFSMFVTPGSEQIYKDGYEIFSARITKNMVKNYDLFIDVGANYGYYSLLAAYANKKVNIIAIEPNDENIKILRMNLSFNNISNDRVKCIPSVISPSKKAPYSYHSEIYASSDLFQHPNSSTSGLLTMQSVGINDILDDIKTKRVFIKIDADGNEIDTLKGLSPTLINCFDVRILLKVNAKKSKNCNTTLREIREYLHNHDFVLYAIDENKFRFYPLNIKENIIMLESIHEKSFFNIICVPKRQALSVIFFSHTSELGGAERSLLDLVNGLSQLGTLCTTVMAYQGPLLQKMQEIGCAVYNILPEGDDNNLKSWWWAGNSSEDYDALKFAYTLDFIHNIILPELIKISPDIIFSQTIISPWGAVCADLLGIPHVLSAREYGVLDHDLNFYFNFEESMMALYNSSNAVFCITKDVRDKLYHDDSEEKTTVIYSGIDDKFINAAANADIKSCGLPDLNLGDSVAIGVFGTICRTKGQKDLINACIYLLKINLNIKCFLIGRLEMNYQQEIIQLIDNSGFSDRFKIIDFIENPYPLMRKMNIIVSCSAKEALGRSLIEAILLRKPIIYANDGGPREIFTDGVHGLSYTPGNYQELAERIWATITEEELTNKRIYEAINYVLTNFTNESYSQKVHQKLINIKNKKQLKIDSVSELLNKKLVHDLTLAVRQLEEIAASNRDTIRQFEELTASNRDTIRQFEELAASNHNTIRQLEEIAASNRDTIRQFEELAASNCDTIRQLKELAASNRDTISQLERTLEEKKQLITGVYASRSWRITRPLRQIDNLIRKLR
jgi:FkbM family methyltransferase